MAKLKLRHLYEPRRELGIAKAVEVACDGSGYDMGQLETIEETAERTAILVGRLVEKLHDKGVISPDEVIDILGGNWGVV